MGVRLLGKTGRLQTGGALGSAVGADEEDKAKEQQTTTGEAAFGGGGGAVKPVTQQAAPQTKGSGFTNIQKILKASGTDTGPSRLARTAAGGVRQAASGAEQALTGAVEKFGKETTTAAGAIPTSGTVSGIITGALGGTLSDADLSTWQKAESGTYAGPTTLQMTPEQQRKAAQSSALSKLAGDVSGRSALLQKYVGSPQYGQSKQTLDTLLLGRGGSAALRGALRQGARTEQDIKRQEIVAQEQAKQAQERARGIAEEAKTGLEQAKTGLMGQLETNKTQFLENEIKNAVGRVIGAFQRGGNISRKDLNLLNLNEADFENLRYEVGSEGAPIKEDIIKSLQDLYKTGEATAFASQQQKAAARALGQLSGQENIGLNLLDSVYSLDTTANSYFDLPAYKAAVERKIEDRLVNDPILVSKKKDIGFFGESLGNIQYQGSGLFNSIGQFLGIDGWNKLDLNNIADSIDYGKTSFNSIKDQIRAWIDSEKPTNFTYRNSKGRVINMQGDLAYDGDPFKRKDAVADELANIAFLKARQQKEYNSLYNDIKNKPKLKFTFID